MGRIERFLGRLDRKHRQVPITIASIVILGLLLIGAGGVAWQASIEQHRAERLHVHTLDVLLTADEVQIGALNVLRGERGFLLTGRTEYLEPFHEGSRSVRSSLNRLGELTRDNPAQQARIAVLRAEIDGYLRLLGRIVNLHQSGHTEQAIAIVRKGDGRAAIQAINHTLATIEATERELLGQRSDLAEQTGRFHMSVLVIVMLAGCVLLAFASVAVIALRGAFDREAVYLRELRRIAETDELTGIANRRELLAALQRAIAATRRAGEPLAFAMLDIDHFKRVNDTLGHGAGDAVIRRVAEIAAECVRGGDVAGRLGGEEFALVLPGADADAATMICERLRTTLDKTPIALRDGGSVHVTISSGISMLCDGDTGDSLVARADRALYSSKDAGRNRVSLAA